jgi:RNA recognition motif-containing protein
VCRFDRNEFGQFLGCATVTFERPEDARRAVQEYNGAYLDDKVLTVEFDMVTSVTHVVKAENASGNANGQTRPGPVIKPRGGNGKTLKLHK